MLVPLFRDVTPHSLRNNVVSYPTCRSKLSQICLIGDKSGERANQGRVLMDGGSLGVSLLCGRALSCGKVLLESLPLVVTHSAEICHILVTGLLMCHRAILRVNVYRKQWHSIPSNQLWEKWAAVTRRQD
ncbi:hypothetical protein TNCV_445361 [Trichonephila clavipes]|nr:hypothetical protein TNCV_445361 [Trichonephila clavipes]